MSSHPSSIWPDCTADPMIRTGGRDAGGRTVVNTTAAAPSTIDGQHCSSVSGSATSRDCSTSSIETALRCCAKGLRTPCALFFTPFVQVARSPHRIDSRQRHALRSIELGLVVIALQRNGAAAKLGKLFHAP